jgi:hypothetical protein
MNLGLAEVTTPTWNSAGPSSWYRKFRRLDDVPVNSPTAPSPMTRTSSPRAGESSRLQAFCKHRASTAFHPVPPKCTAAAQNWLGPCISAEYGGTRVHNRGGS